MLTILGMSLLEQEECEELILYPSATFDAYYEEWWLDSDFGRDVISTIQCFDVHDKSRTVKSILLEHNMRIEDLATGTKNLLNCKFLDDGRYCRLGMMGENCYRFLIDVAVEKNLTAVMVQPYEFTDDDLRGNVVYFADIGRYARTNKEFLDCLGGLLSMEVFTEKMPWN